MITEVWLEIHGSTSAGGIAIPPRLQKWQASVLEGAATVLGEEELPQAVEKRRAPGALVEAGVVDAFQCSSSCSFYSRRRTKRGENQFWKSPLLTLRDLGDAR